MSDLIDKDALLNSIYSDNPTDIMLYIAEFPSAVVRCKECKWFKSKMIPTTVKCLIYSEPFDYCSYGERRE